MRFYVSDKSKVRLLAMTFMLMGYESCGGTTGMGFLQARASMDAQEIERHCPPREHHSRKGEFEVYGDYVAGRMMKTGISFNENEGWVEVRDTAPTPDYQGWSSGTPRDPGVLASFRLMGGGGGTKYDSYEALLKAAAAKLGVDLEEMQARDERLAKEAATT